jgi:hypothetical protein
LLVHLRRLLECNTQIHNDVGYGAENPSSA